MAKNQQRQDEPASPETPTSGRQSRREQLSRGPSAKESGELKQDARPVPRSIEEEIDRRRERSRTLRELNRSRLIRRR